MKNMKNAIINKSKKHIMTLLYLVFCTSLLSTSKSFAHSLPECTQREAQFAGQVSQIRMEESNEEIKMCFFKISFEIFNPSVVCPLVRSEAENLEIANANCTISIGQELSGVLVLKNGELFLD